MDGPLPMAAVLLAVVMLVCLVRVLGLGTSPRLAGIREAEEIAQSLPGGFLASESALATDGASALLRDADGRIAVVAAIGSHFLVRLHEPDWSVGPVADGRLTITGVDFSCTLLLAGSAQHWLDALRRAQMAAA